MAIQKERFGEMPDGREISLYTVTNDNGLSASVTNLGAAWVRMLVPDREGNLADVLLGYDGAAEYLAGSPHFGATVGRVANRVGGARFWLEEREYLLAKNERDNNLHSGPDYWENRLWEAACGADEKSVMFTLESPDGDQGYPGNARISVIYRLNEEDCLEITYHASCDRATPMNPTNHAYFNLGGHDSGSVLAHKARILADFYTPVGPDLIPTGEIASVTGTPMDFREWKTFADEIGADFTALLYGGGYDHNWCLNHAASVYSLAAEAWDEKSGRAMEVWTDLPGVQLYTGNGLSDTGKGGVRYRPRDGFCFETQFFPDALNKPHFQSPVMKVGEVFTTKTGYRFIRK
ncbi:MAG: galactose mutarotase [Lachnospiraceae bacterium]|nr:galactose mutarotase [Lachnospiraceae bacterium]